MAKDKADLELFKISKRFPETSPYLKLEKFLTSFIKSLI